MKILLFVTLCFLGISSYAQETLGDFFKMSQEKLKNYSLAELMGLDPIKDKDSLEHLSKNIKVDTIYYLFLNHLSTLSSTQASILAQFQGDWLFLNGLKQLDEATAKALSKWQGRVLYLNGVQQLDEATAKMLSQFNGRELHLNGLKQLDEAIAKVLAQWKGKAFDQWKGENLSLNGVQELDEATAKALAQWKGFNLSLNGVQQINETTAKALSEWQGVVLSLDGLKELDEATAKVLAQWKGFNLSLDGLKELDEATAKMLAQWRVGFLSLNGIQQLDEATAKTLSQCQIKGLYLNGVQQLDEATAKALAQWQGEEFSLNGVQQLDEATAKTLAQWQGEELYLNGVQQLDESTAKALAQWRGSYLFLNGVQQLDEATAKAFAQCQRDVLLFHGVQQLDESTAKALSQFKGDYLYLSGVQQLDEAAAKALAQWQGEELYLNGVQQLNEATAKALAQCHGVRLYLNGLKELDETTAKALAQWQGKLLELNGIQDLDKATAKALAQFKGNSISLSGIQELDDATVKEFVQSIVSVKIKEELREKITNQKKINFEPLLALSQENLKKYSLSELTGLDSEKDKYTLSSISADIMSNPNSHLFLNHLSELSIDQACALSQFRGKAIYLNDVKQIDEVLIKALSQNIFTSNLYLNGLQTLDKTMAQTLVQFGYSRLFLDGLESIDEEVATILVQFKRSLSLNGLKKLDESLAKILSQFQGDSLSLNGLEWMDKAVAKALLEYKGRIYTKGTVFLEDRTPKESSEGIICRYYYDLDNCCTSPRNKYSDFCDKHYNYLSVNGFKVRSYTKETVFLEDRETPKASSEDVICRQYDLDNRCTFPKNKSSDFCDKHYNEIEIGVQEEKELRKTKEILVKLKSTSEKEIFEQSLKDLEITLKSSYTTDWIKLERDEIQNVYLKIKESQDLTDRRDKRINEIVLLEQTKTKESMMKIINICLDFNLEVRQKAYQSLENMLSKENLTDSDIIQIFYENSEKPSHSMDENLSNVLYCLLEKNPKWKTIIVDYLNHKGFERAFVAAKILKNVKLEEDVREKVDLLNKIEKLKRRNINDKRFLEERIRFLKMEMSYGIPGEPSSQLLFIKNYLRICSEVEPKIIYEREATLEEIHEAEKWLQKFPPEIFDIEKKIQELEVDISEGIPLTPQDEEWFLNLDRWMKAQQLIQAQEKNK